MIVTLDAALFAPEAADDIALIGVISRGHQRYKVQTWPAYRSRRDPLRAAVVHRWLEAQSPRVRERLHVVLEEGLKAPQYMLTGGARESCIIIEHREAPEWPDDLVQKPARLPLTAAQELLERPLHLLLENGRNDWAFLAKVVPTHWKARWERAVANRWLEQQNGGGITEMRRIAEEQLAMDHVRRLRTWAMFDSDGRHVGDASTQSEDTRKACEDWCIAYHRLRRRAIENYIPREVLYDWAWRRHPRAVQQEMLARVRAYCALAGDEDRHYFDMKAGFHKELAQHVWSDDEKDDKGFPVVYAVREVDLERDGFGSNERDEAPSERVELFQSLFSRL